MKKRNLAALALLAVMLLTACGRAADAAVTTGEIVVPEMSSKDMLVNSLEYLLEEEEEVQTQEPVPETESDGDSAEEDVAQGTEEVNEVQEAAEEDDTQQAAVICYGKDMDSELTQEEITAEEITPDVLLSALARHNIVPLFHTKALSLEEREEEGRRLIYLDLSEGFREYLLTMSAEAECIIISSIVNTFLSNYDADAVYITVEGETLATSHTEYTEAISGDMPEEIMAYLTASENETEADAADQEEE